jgi:phosphonate transport system permease protein
MPRLIGLSMYRLDINFRESAILGLVGAGGIGATLNTAFDRYEFDTAAAILLIIIVTVMVLEYLSGIIGRRCSNAGLEPPRTVPRSGNCATATRPRPLGGYLVGCRRLHVVLAADFGATTWFFVWDAPRSPPTSDGATGRRAGNTSPISGRPIWDTLNMATLGTLLALVLAVPVAFLAARNTTPSASVHPARRAVHHRSTRSINSLIWALLLIAIIGPGVFAGLSPSPSARSGSAPSCSTRRSRRSTLPRSRRSPRPAPSRWQVMAYGIVPQIMPAFAGISVFRWDINIRESTVLGLVGAGGIGLQLAILAQRAGLAAGHADPDCHPSLPS